MSESVDSLLAILGAHRPWAALTGAGISSASGIPTYRDHKGTWLGSQPIQHDEFISDPSKRERYWSRSALGWPRVGGAQPNESHAALVKLEQAGLLTGIITQNVDRLHQRAGSQSVVDLHGRLDRVKCLDCAQVTSREAIQSWIETHNELPNTASLTLWPDGDADRDTSACDCYLPYCLTRVHTMVRFIVHWKKSRVGRSPGVRERVRERVRLLFVCGSFAKFGAPGTVCELGLFTNVRLLFVYETSGRELAR